MGGTSWAEQNSRTDTEDEEDRREPSRTSSEDDGQQVEPRLGHVSWAIAKVLMFDVL